MKKHIWSHPLLVVIAALFILTGWSNTGWSDEGPWKKRILAYGDSNTFGWYFNENGTADRYPLEVAWPGQLQAALGEDYEVIVEGLGGRTTNVSPPFDFGSGEIGGLGLNGAAYLPAALSSHMPLDLVIIMLGTNDLRVELNRQPEDIASGVMELAAIVMDGRWQTQTGFKNPQVIVVSPTKLNVRGRFADLFAGSMAKIEALPGILKPMAEKAGAHFFDAAVLIPFPEEPDEIHLNPKNHETLGQALAAEVLTILK